MERKQAIKTTKLAYQKHTCTAPSGVMGRQKGKGTTLL
jgi:hypothetical protein